MPNTRYILVLSGNLIEAQKAFHKMLDILGLKGITPDVVKDRSIIIRDLDIFFTTAKYYNQYGGSLDTYRLYCSFEVEKILKDIEECISK